jgi:hypothetical protein
MRFLVLVGAVLASAASVVAQTPTVQLTPSKPMTTITLTSVPFDQAIAAVAADFGLEAEFDPEIPAEDLARELKVRFVNAEFKDVLSFLTNQAGLTYRVIGPKTIRIEKKR